MNIPPLYSDQDFNFQNISINPDLIDALKLRTQVFLDPRMTSRDALDHAELDFGQDLSRMIELYINSQTHHEQNRDVQLNLLFQHCLGFKIRHLEQISEAMPTIRNSDLDLSLYELLQTKISEVKIFFDIIINDIVFISILYGNKYQKYFYRMWKVTHDSCRLSWKPEKEHGEIMRICCLDPLTLHHYPLQDLQHNRF
jgi:hypothetical protein